MSNPVPIYDAMGNVTGYQEIEETPVNEPTTSMMSLDYYKTKVIEFQDVLYNLDNTAAIVANLIDEQISPELSVDLQSFMQQYDNKKGYYRTAAEALNLAINGVNVFGAGLPSVRVPAGLAMAPIAMGAAVAAALAAAAALVVWGKEWIVGVNDRLKTELLLGKISDPVKRDAATAALLLTEANAKAAQGSSLSQISNIVKWVAIGALAYFAFQAYSKTRG
jgi:hypothetical protein